MQAIWKDGMTSVTLPSSEHTGLDGNAFGIGYIFFANEANFGGDSGAGGITGASGGVEGITGAGVITGTTGCSSLLLLLSGGVGSFIGGGEGGLIFVLDFFFKFLFDGGPLFGGA